MTSGSNDSLITTGSGDSLIATGGSDSLITNGSGDSLIASGSGDSLVGFGNYDSLFTSGSGDSLIGTGSSDSLLTTGSGDSLIATGANDSLVNSSGAGDSLVNSSGSNNTLVGVGNFDSLTTTGGADNTLIGGTGSNESLIASGGTGMTLYGGFGNGDFLSASGVTNGLLIGGTGGGDSLYASDSTDVLLAAGDQATYLSETNSTGITLLGGMGNDTLAATGGSGILANGEAGSNLYDVTGSAADPVYVELVNLQIAAGPQGSSDSSQVGTDTIAFPGVGVGGSAGVTLDLRQTSASGASDSLLPQPVSTGVSLTLAGQFQNVIGTAGNNTIYGGDANTSLVGGVGNDTLVAGTGDATLVAGTGNDVLVGGNAKTTYVFTPKSTGNDVVDQPLSTLSDTLDFSQITAAVTVDISRAGTQTVAPGLSITLTNPSAIADVIGNQANDRITGNSRDDQFFIGAGNNTLAGGSGNDTYNFTGAALGNDVINDQSGASTGSSGTMTFAKADTLNYHQFDGPVSIDLTKPVQTVSGSSTLTVADPLAFANVVGNDYGDTIRGNARNNILVGGGGQSTVIAGTGENNILEAGVNQVVLLDFDTETTPAEHQYTTTERNAIQQQLQGYLADFNVTFTQDPAVAQELSQVLGGQYFTVYFNSGNTGGGHAEIIGWRHVLQSASAIVDVNGVLPIDNIPYSSANFATLSGAVAAHELGHMFGLRHADSFGPVGTGIYFNGVVTEFYANFNSSRDFNLPAPVESTNPTNTPHDIMQTPVPLDLPDSDLFGPLSYGERDAVKLAFDDTGTVINEQPTAYQSPLGQALGALPALTVPNTLVPGDQDYGATFDVHAIDVVGALGTPAEHDLYSFTGHKGDIMNVALMSNNLNLNPHPFDTYLYLYDATGPGGTPGTLLAANDDEFESSDSALIDFELPADGTYYLSAQSFHGASAGNYELFMYSFAVGSPDGGSGNTLIGGSGQTTFIDSSGNDQISFLPGSTGTATVIGGSGFDTIDASNDPGISLVASDRVAVQAAAIVGTSFRYQTTASRTDLNDTLTFSLAPVPTTETVDSDLALPSDAGIDPATGILSWDPTGPGIYAVRIVTTRSSGETDYQDLTINVEGPAATTTTVQAPSNSAVFGQSVTWTATVSSNQAGLAQTPTGTVTFYDNGATIGTGSLQVVNGQDQATFATVALPVGTNLITAAYTSGDASFQASPPSGAVAQVVNPASTATSLATSVNPSVSGQGVTFTATVTDSTPGSAPSAAPTGLVTFFDNGDNGNNAIGTGTLQVINGVDEATFTTASLSTTGHTITAAYTSGDASFSVSPASNAIAQQVNTAITTTTIVSSTATTVSGQSVTFTATVAVVSPGSTVVANPTGTVTFYANCAVIGTGTLSSSGGATTASFSTAVLSTASHTITAKYTSGDTNFSASPVSAGITETVQKADTSLSVISSAAQSVSGQSVTFTATVTVNSPGSTAVAAPTGTVTFYDNGQVLGTAGLQLVHGADQATLSSSVLSSGSHAITAAYTSGDSNFNPVAPGSSITQIVNRGATTTTVATSSVNNASVSGEAVTLTAAVAVVTPGSTAVAVPSGTVTFFDGAVPISPPESLSSLGGVTTASFTTSTLSTAPHSITAVYNGDGDFIGSASAVLTQAVTRARTSTTVSSSAASSVSGQSVALTATIGLLTPATTAVAAPTGSVVFYDDGAAISAAIPLVTTNGVTSASLTTATLSVGAHSITAVYMDDANFAPSDSTGSPLTQTVNMASTTTTILSSANPSVSGQSVTWTAQVTVSNPGSQAAANPTGTVTFYDGGAVLGTGTLSNSALDTATLTLNTLSTGTHSITAKYTSGDGNYFASAMSTTVAQVVNKADTTTSVSSSGSPTVSGEAVTFTATIAASSPGSSAVGVPTGTATFYDNGQPIGTAPLSTSGGVTTAVFRTSTLSTTTHTVTAAYSSGDANFNGSKAATLLTQVVNAASTTTTVASSANPSVSGQSVTFTATVTVNSPGSQAAANPTGTVTFYDGGVAIGTGTLSATAVDTATFTLNTFSTGTHAITAVYTSGDGNFNPRGASNTVDQVVNKADTSTSVVSSVNPSVSGQRVTLTATVVVNSPGSQAVANPTGTVTFYDGGNAIGTATLSNTATDTATFTTSTLATATHAISVVYTSGDRNFNTSAASSTVNQVVNKASTTTNVVSSVNPSVSGESATFTATVIVNGPGSQAVANPTGTVTFYDGGNAIGTATLSNTATDTATFTTSTLATARHAITAVYTSGDGNFNPSGASNTINEVVNKADTTTSVASSVNPSVSGQSVTFTATVTVNSPGSQAVANPTGTVTFYDGGVAIGTGTLINAATDTATFTTSVLATTTHAITAAYTSGDGNFTPSVGSATVNQVVNKASTTTSVVSSVNPSAAGQNVTFTATVTVIGPGSQAAANPTGTVTFYDGGVAIGNGTLSNAATDTATFATNALSGGTHAITAAYTSGDNNFNPSLMSTAITQSVVSFVLMNPTSNGALTVSGSGNITVPGALEIDSDSKTALVASGSAVVRAPVIDIVGGDNISGQASVSQPIHTGVAASSIVDPLAGLAAPSVTGSLQPAVNASGSLTIHPGIYAGITVSGSGSLTMTPGIYVIAGGGFTVSGGASVSATGVMIYNAGNNYVTPGGKTFGAVNLSSHGTISISSPTSGAYTGIAIFQSRDNAQGMTVSTTSVAGVSISGTIYALNAPVTLSGSAKLVDGLVASTLNISGSAIFNTQAGMAGYTPAQVRGAYGINNLALDGAGQTIAVVDAYDNPAIFQSVDAFDQQLGLTSTGATLYQQYGPASSFLRVLNQSGQAAPLPPTDPTGTGVANWELETSLDVEWIHATAPGAQIVLVEASSQSLSDLMNSVATAASQPSVSVVSMSWGFAEGQSVLATDEATYDPYLTTPAGHQGVTFVASTGDYGAEDPVYPAFSPNVVAVGGTTLALNSDNSYHTETGWGNDAGTTGAFIGSGGGLSQYEPEPAYQAGVQSTGYRAIPDVSFVADPATGAWIADAYNLGLDNPWEVVGGTSLSAPAWAGVMALVNQGRAAAGQPTLNSSSPTEAQHDLYSLSQNDYHAISSGFNGYSAGAGYNLVTGLGSPIVDLLATDLIAGNYPASGQVAPISAADLVYSGGSGGGSGGSSVMTVFTAQPIGRSWSSVLSRAADPFALSSAVSNPSGPLRQTSGLPAAGGVMGLSPATHGNSDPSIAPITGISGAATPCGSGNATAPLSNTTLGLSRDTGTLPAAFAQFAADDSDAVVLGSPGTDIVIGGTRRKLLIGGLGTAALTQANGSDALVVGSLPSDAEAAALDQLLTEWSADGVSLQRTTAINGSEAYDNKAGFLIAAAICDVAIYKMLSGSGRSRLALRRSRRDGERSHEPHDRP
jgi:hypothetical protein